MFRITTVCTGNICRSPLAESLLRAELPPDIFTMTSAGVAAVVQGEVPDPQIRIGDSLGLIDLREHRAQALVPGMVGVSDLILAMSRGHRKRLVRMDPQAVRRIFTLREFAYLAEYVTPDNVEAALADVPTPLAAAVEAVARLRGMVPPLPTKDHLDIVDPFRQTRAIYKQSRDELVPAAQVTAAYLKGVVEIFGVTGRDEERRPMTEPDIISQGIPKVEVLPTRGELRRADKSVA